MIHLRVLYNGNSLINQSINQSIRIVLNF